jgi:polysaccharide export outer membrane protein
MKYSMKCLAVLCALWLSAVPTLAAPLKAAPAAVSSSLIRAGDTLDIQVAGEPGLTKSYAVDAAGQITLDLVGQVRAVGRTPQQIARDLRTRLSRYLNRPDVIVTSSTPLRKEVMVTGEVLKPGIVPLRPGDGLLDALGAAGGISPMGDAAKATLVRRGEMKPQPLQVQALLSGDLTQNLSLNDGDIIQIPRREIASFQILGEVKDPGTKLLGGQIRVLDALLASGGLSERADRNRVTLTRKAQAQPIVIDLDQVIAGDSSANLLLQADDVITVASRMIVSVGGEVANPGTKLLRNGGTLMEAVSVAGGFTPNADRATVQVTHRDGTTDAVSLADVTAIVGGPVLKVDDMVIVGRAKPQFITLTGAVRNQGQMPYRKDLKITDALMAASLLETAKWKEIRVLRGEDGPNRKIMVFNLESYLKTPQTQNLALEAGDQIFVEAAPPRRQGGSFLDTLLRVVPLAGVFFSVTR